MLAALLAPGGAPQPQRGAQGHAPRNLPPRNPVTSAGGGAYILAVSEVFLMRFAVEGGAPVCTPKKQNAI